MPSRPDDDRLLSLALAITDGTPVDWATQSSAAQDSPFVDSLRDIAALASVHAAGAAEPLRSWGALQVLERVGHGSYGDVYRAIDPSLGREVALKLLRDRRPQQSPLVLEGHLLARVRHPNVVTVYGAARLDGRSGLWMEFVRGQTLEQELRQRGPLPAEEVRQIGVALASALSAVHAASFLHRDLKAQNVMRDTSGRVILMDFGTGQLASAGGEEGLQGTPAYLAPEVIAGGTPTQRSDIFALGVLLFHLATNSFPFTGRTLAEIGRSQWTNARDRSAVLRGLPSPLSTVLRKALAVDPGARWATAAAMRDALAKAPLARSWRVRATAGVLSLAIGALVVSSWRFHDSVRPQSAPPPRGLYAGAEAILSKAPVLVGSFENATGDLSLDDSVEAALTLALDDNPTLTVVSIDREFDAMSAIKARYPITTTVAGQLLEMDRGLQAALTGRLEHEGAAYLVRAELKRPGVGDLKLQARSDSADGLIGAAAEIAASLQSQMGRRAGAYHAPATQSIRAMTAYYRAIHSTTPWSARAVVARRAADLDPAFAVAQTTAAWTLKNAGAKPSELEPYLDRSAKLVGAVTGPDRYWMVALQSWIAGDERKAGAALKALLAENPDHYAALAAIARRYTARDPNLDVTSCLVALAAAHPLSVPAHANAANALLLSGQGIDAAAPYVAKISSLTEDEARARQFFYQAAWARVFPAFERWASGDVTEAARLADAAFNRVRAQPAGALREAQLSWLFHLNLTLGRVRLALEQSALLTDANARKTRRAVAFVAAGDVASAAAEVRGIPADVEFPFVSWVLAMAGDVDAVSERLGREPTAAESGIDGIARGQMLLARGRPDGAVALFREALVSARVTQGNPTFYRASEALADALTRIGEREQARATLQNAWTNDAALVSRLLPFGYFWLRDGVALARADREAGKITEAREVEARLSTYLAAAEPDFPLLVELRRLRARP